MNRGEQAETLASGYLQAQGLRLLEKNYRSRFGEIDLICQDGEVVVFVEVRLRTNARFGGAGASISTAKRQKLIATAQTYLSSRRPPPACRFDVVCMQDLHVSPEWIKNAFDA